MGRDVRLASLIAHNPLLLVMMEHFDLDHAVGSRTVERVCSDNGIPLEVFLAIANLYSGAPFAMPSLTVPNLLGVLAFLTNCHAYYKQEMYHQVSAQIALMQRLNHSPEVLLIDRFFQDYFHEVLEHLAYEDDVVFPYIQGLISGRRSQPSTRFCASTYQSRHTDIGVKLRDLKELLLAHIPINGDRKPRRQLLLLLIELDRDLAVHSAVEERILIPTIRALERG